MKYAVFLLNGAAKRGIPHPEEPTWLTLGDMRTLKERLRWGEIGLTDPRCHCGAASPYTSVLAAMGYDPVDCFAGESYYQGFYGQLPLSEEDIIFRCSFLSLSESEEEPSKSISAVIEDIPTPEEQQELLACLRQTVNEKVFEFVTDSWGQLYLIWHQGDPSVSSLPDPYELLETAVGDAMPKGNYAELIQKLLLGSIQLLPQTEFCQRLKQEDKPTADMLWLSHTGRKLPVESFSVRFGLRPALLTDDRITAGIGQSLGMEARYLFEEDVHQTARQYAEAAVEYFKTAADIVFLSLQIQAFPDPVEALSVLDREMMAPVFQYFDSIGEDYRVLVLTGPQEEETPIGGSNYPVPYAICSHSESQQEDFQSFDELSAVESDRFYSSSMALLEEFLKQDTH